MPKRTVQSGPDFVGGTLSGFGATLDGRIFPVERNLLFDPTFTNLGSDGFLFGWATPNYPLPVKGQNIYVRSPGAAVRRRPRVDTDLGAYYVFENPSGASTLPPANND